MTEKLLTEMLSINTSKQTNKQTLCEHTNVDVIHCDFYPCTSDNFQMKNCDNFSKTRDCWYALEKQKKKIKVYTCKAQFYHIKVGFKGVYTHISLASFLWDIGKQNSPKCDAAKSASHLGIFCLLAGNSWKNEIKMKIYS